MCKRFIAIPLLCLVLFMAACPFSVYADSFPYPENNVSGSYTVYFASRNATGVMCQGRASYNFGQLWTGKFISLDDSEDPSGDHGSMGYGLSLMSDINLTITVGGDLFLALPYHIDESYLTTGALAPYRSESGDYNVNFGDDWPVNTYTPVPDSLTFNSGFGAGSVYIRFVCYRNVPAGEYTLTYQFEDNYTPICFGVYATRGNQMNAIVDQFVNQIPSSLPVPSDALSAFMTELWEYRESLESDSIEESMLRELEYHSALEYLLNQVDIKYIGFLQGLSSEVNALLQRLASGQIDYSSFISFVSNATSNASQLCSTTDQYQCLSSYLLNTLQIAEGIERQKAKANMDQAISDGDIDEIQSYYDAEQQLILAFDQAKFQAQLDFDTWFTLLPPDETIEYKKFFDYILNDSPIKNYIMIPVSMGLVTILLGTGIRFVGSKRGDYHD